MSNNAQSVPYDGYPADGASATRPEWAGDHFGPGPSQGNYQAGGYNLNASALGMSRIEVLSFAARSQSGNYYALPFYPAASNINETRAIPPSYVTVKWYTAANGVEVANNTSLIAEVTLMTARGLG